jgi:transposase-like protein
MARHRSFSSEFKCQLAREFLEGRAGMHELARRYSLSDVRIGALDVRVERPGQSQQRLCEAAKVCSRLRFEVLYFAYGNL